MNKFFTLFVLMASLYAVGQDSLRGIIIDNYTQTPINEAIVSNGTKTVITQADGRFAFACAEKTNIIVTHENYVSWKAMGITWPVSRCLGSHTYPCRCPCYGPSKVQGA